MPRRATGPASTGAKAHGRVVERHTVGCRRGGARAGRPQPGGGGRAGRADARLPGAPLRLGVPVAGLGLVLRPPADHQCDPVRPVPPHHGCHAAPARPAARRPHAADRRRLRRADAEAGAAHRRPAPDRRRADPARGGPAQARGDRQDRLAAAHACGGAALSRRQFRHHADVPAAARDAGHRAPPQPARGAARDPARRHVRDRRVRRKAQEPSLPSLRADALAPDQGRAVPRRVLERGPRRGPAGMRARGAPRRRAGRAGRPLRRLLPCGPLPCRRTPPAAPSRRHGACACSRTARSGSFC